MDLTFNSLATKYSPEAVLHALQRGHLVCFTGKAPVDCMEARDYDNTHPKPSGPEEISYRAILDGLEPRWKEGARARLEYADGSILEGFIDNAGRVLYGNGWGSKEAGSKSPRIYLLAEAPDPDREILEKIKDALTGLYDSPDDEAREILRIAREG